MDSGKKNVRDSWKAAKIEKTTAATVTARPIRAIVTGMAAEEQPGRPAASPFVIPRASLTVLSGVYCGLRPSILLTLIYRSPKQV